MSRLLVFPRSSKKDGPHAVILNYERITDDNMTVPVGISDFLNSGDMTMYNLHVPEPRRAIEVLTFGLKQNFRDVSVEWVQCPDLRTYNLAAQGLCGSTALLEVGSLSYLFPMPRFNKAYNFMNLLTQVGRTELSNFILGAAKHSHPPEYELGELFTNLVASPINKLDGSISIHNNSFLSCSSNGNYSMKCLQHTDPTFCIQGNFFLSEGRRENIFQISVCRRTGLYDFVTSIQRILPNMRLQLTDPPLIGLGGMFKVHGNALFHHVMPSFYNMQPLYTTKQIQQWLNYKKLVEPMVAVGTIVSDGGTALRSNINECYDQFSSNFHLTTKHFHSISRSGSGGHYYTDCMDQTSSNVEYVGYFSFAETLYRIDPPRSRDIFTDMKEFLLPAHYNSLF